MLHFFDGAMGTLLQAAGLPAGAAPESFNLEHPDIVENIHRKYIDADIITTNSFGASPLKLRHFDLYRQPRAKIRAAYHSIESKL